MLKKQILIILLLFAALLSVAQNKTLISKTQEPVSYATISFGNGNGLFADDMGKFYFTKKLYKDIDTLYISAVGYNDLKLPTIDLSSTIVMESKVDKLQEVIIKNKPKGPFKIKKIKPTTHEDYYKCWLPTVESEIAVFFENNSQETKRLTKLKIPIKVEAKAWRKRNKANSKKRAFSTLFKVNFYENNNGLPGDVLTYDKVIFVATEKNEKIYELDVKPFDIYVPKSGIFISLQVLGYTDAKGKLLPSKKYQEIKTKRGTVKVSTTFRPLLPFTDKIEEKRTFVKRIFLNDGKWVLYDRQNINKSKLLLEGLNNYGIGLEMEVYKKEE
ncbi:hypothetical protein [uncultured Lacinutrix sp.]|uniref:hypothetical protein n=1 Tax=uncultured Lacinutrix sp. TaxID=574032 RepID=UPI00260F7F6C|nr:hypothetical protein [uncultured Lacinutrix sp.]